MSENPTLVTAEHFRYLRERTVREDDFLRDLKRAAGEAGLPPISISPEQGSLLQILLRLSGAREVVEVGTLAGYSAIVMARALPEGGRLRTIEIDPVFAGFAERWIARSDVAARVQVLRGPGRDLLPAIPAGSVDAVFLDADKAGYPDYLAESRRILRTGGLLAVDNAFAFGQLFDERPTDPEAPAVKAFNEIMAREPVFQSVIVPLGDGCWVGVRKGPAGGG